MEVRKKSNRYCSVPQCSTRSSKDVSFHYFPRDKKTQKEWCRILRIGKPVSQYMNVCSLHFSKDDYFFPDVHAGKKYLKTGSIPSKNLPISSCNLRPSDTQILLQKARMERAKQRQTYCEAVPTTSENKFGMDINVLPNPAEKISPESHQNCVPEIIFEDKSIQVSPSLEFCQKITLNDMIKTNTHLNAFTGISSQNLLDKICVAAEKLEREHTKPLILTLKLRVVLVFVKLKNNLSFLCLSVLFGVTANTCKNYFQITLEVLAEVLKPAVPWLEKEIILKRMPICFKKFAKTRIILDCTEIAVEKNKCLKCRILSYSHYKGDHTLKIMIGVAPSGLITFVSPVYGGRVSDKEIFLQSNLLRKLLPNCDAVMVDKGFLIEKECGEQNIELIRPPFLGKKEQLSAEDAMYTAEIAAARVHVERTIQRLKIFKILKGRMPLHLVPYINSIINIISGIVNLSAPILHDDKY